MSRAYTILIVDDEPLNQELLEGLLEPEGYGLAFASDGLEALRQAEATSPDLILLDVMMPGMNGFEVCQQLRATASLAEVPVIMLTALSDRESRLQGIEAGADDFISKPFDHAELRLRVRTITRLNRYRRLVNERTKFEWVVEQSHDGYLIVGANGAIQYANAQARRYLGEPVDGADLNGTFLEIVDRQYHLQPSVTWSEWLATPGGDLAVPRFLVRPASGNAATFMLQANLLEMAPDPEPRYLVHLRDISASVIDQQSVWTFQALIRHKLSTSLSSLLGGLRMIKEIEMDAADEMLAELFGIASEGAEKLQADMDDIFAYMAAPEMARPDQGCCALSELPAIIAEISAQVEGASIHFEAPALQDSPTIEIAISRRALAMILAELVENARKFHPQGAPAIEITATCDGDMVHLHVRDDGSSLSPDQLARVWLPYYQGERYFTGQVPGMGLGLPLVATLIWRSGGTCRINNRNPGPGVDVELAIPLWKDEG